MASKEINLPELIVERYEVKDIVAFLLSKLKTYNNRDGAEYADRELGIYISIMEALNKKLGGGNGPVIL